MSAKGLLALVALPIAACALAISPSHAQSEPTTTDPFGFSDSHPKPMTTDPNEPAGFKIAYGLTFFFYDACGDSEAGQIARRAVLEQFNKCQFPQEVREKFRDWLIETLEEFATVGYRAAVEGKDLTPSPDFLGDGSIKTCEAYRETKDYWEKRELLLKYGRKEAGVSQVVGDDCTLGPAAL